MRLVICAGLVLLSSTAYAGVAEDDLALVRRAVAEEPRSAASAPPAAAAPAKETRRATEPRFFRVRIVDKKEKNTVVSVNLPLGLVRALGDDLALDDDWHDRGGRRLRLGDILRALDAGQNIVEVDAKDASIKVWVE